MGGRKKTGPVLEKNARVRSSYGTQSLTVSEIVIKTLNCPKGAWPDGAKKLRKQKTFKGVDIEYAAHAFVCQVRSPRFDRRWKTEKKAGSAIILWVELLKISIMKMVKTDVAFENDKKFVLDLKEIEHKCFGDCYPIDSMKPMRIERTFFNNADRETEEAMREKYKNPKALE